MFWKGNWKNWEAILLVWDVLNDYLWSLREGVGEVAAVFGGRRGEKEEEKMMWTKSLFFFLPGWKALNLKKIVIFFIFLYSLISNLICCTGLFAKKQTNPAFCLKWISHAHIKFPYKILPLEFCLSESLAFFPYPLRDIIRPNTFT